MWWPEAVVVVADLAAAVEPADFVLARDCLLPLERITPLQSEVAAQPGHLEAALAVPGIILYSAQLLARVVVAADRSMQPMQPLAALAVALDITVTVRPEIRLP